MSDWKWLWSVFGGGNVVNMLGRVEDVVFENDVCWNELEKVLKEKFKEYKEGEIESGYGGGCDDEGNEFDFDWDKVENEMVVVDLEKVLKEKFKEYKEGEIESGDGGRVS